MPEINVDGLLFVFPEGWEVDKFDEWAFYRNQFSKQHNNIKAVDLLALECSKKTLWLIEVKDFSCHKRDKTVDLSDEIFGKIISTLAALLPAKVNASKIEERNFAKKAIKESNIRVVFQVYQPQKPSKLFPKSFDESDLQKEFNISFKSIDPHALVVDGNDMPDCIPWEVRRKQK